MRFVLRSLLRAAAAAVALAPAAALADDDSDSFTVSANVLSTCAVSANDLIFGDYDPISAAHLDAATTLSVVCTNGTPYEVALSLGGGAGATTSNRYMTQGAHGLAYVLYRDAGRTQLWGDDEGVDTLSGIGDGTADVINVYGRVPMQQSVPSGVYDDTITVTVTW